MRFHADLHVHSKYSRATSKHADLEHLAFWAAKKGIAVVGTGDFTHPAWRAELKQKLVPAEPGLFRLRADTERDTARKLPAACDEPIRFMLEVEISTIYKKGDLTRKIHHLIYVPDLDAADRFAARLGQIGNIASDGRPILGLDSRDLLEITLESSPDAYLVPAHIWTPWFAALGSRSGFDSIAECYGDLADHIFAVETGLSSDPPMNWRISELDRYRLVSNSDAHSPIKLGREATTFDTELDYFAIRHALETGEGYVGTIEFFPDEGKYHLDGHRKCGTRLTPEETKRYAGRCPVCGDPVTVGVLHRVEALADRTIDEVTPPATAGEAANLVPLHEVLAEIVGTGPGSQKVDRSYQRLVSALGSELGILGDVPLEDIQHADSSILAEAIGRLRAGQVICQSGYDGEYGVIRLFDDAELRRCLAGGLLFDLPDARKETTPPAAPPATPEPEAAAVAEPSLFQPPEQPSLLPRSGMLADLDREQRAAAEIVHGPLLIVAGPGSGKTRTLTHRIAHLVADHGVPASACLAITFTRRAALEMKERLALLLPEAAEQIAVHTFHSLGLAIVQAHTEAAGLAPGFRIAGTDERVALLATSMDLAERKARSLVHAISKAKRTQDPVTEQVADALTVYQRALQSQNWIDFDDLVRLTLDLLTSNPDLAAHYRERSRWLSVDEFQDVDQQQYRLVRTLAPADANLCAIGDANQAIYGFRGADAACFERFHEDYPSATVVHLTRNYRSSGTIVAASKQVIGPATSGPNAAEIVRAMHERITVHDSPSERAEAEFVVQRIEQMIGGHSFFSIDSGRAANGARAALSFADFAVLYRTEAQASVLHEALARSGMPFKRHSHELLADQTGVQALLHRRDLASGQPLCHQLKSAAEAASREADDGAAIETALQQLLALAQTCRHDPERFTETIPMATEADCFDPRADRVALLTLHAAKGLEFPVVFVVGVEDGILPLFWGKRDDADIEEERRLFYVGMTRARDRLFLSRAVKRQWRGRIQTLAASPFLRAIEAELLEQSSAEVRQKVIDRQLRLS